MNSLNSPCQLLILFVVALVASAAAQNREPASSDITQIQAAIQRNPSDARPYIQLGLAYWERNDDPDALHAFQKAVEVSPRSAEAHNFLGAALMKKSDLPGAVRELRKAVALDPKLVRAYANLGAALARSGEVS